MFLDFLEIEINISGEDCTSDFWTNPNGPYPFTSHRYPGKCALRGAHLHKIGGGGELDCGTDFPNSDIDTIDRKTTLHYLHIQIRLMLEPTFYFS